MCAACDKKLLGEVCTKTVWVHWTTIGTYNNFMEIRAKGKCSVPKKADGRMLFNAAEQAVVLAVSGKPHKVTTQVLKAAFREAGLPVRCKDRQLHQYVTRLNHQGGDYTPPRSKCGGANPIVARAHQFLAGSANV